MAKVYPYVCFTVLALSTVSTVTFFYTDSRTQTVHVPPLYAPSRELGRTCQPDKSNNSLEKKTIVLPVHYNAGARQAERHYTLRRECSKDKSKEKAKCPRLEVVEKYKLLLLMTPKTGGSNWGRLLLSMLGVHNITEYINPGVSNKEFHRLVSYLYKYNETSQKYFRDNFRTVMFVRNPYTRLLSAFRDRLEQYPNVVLNQRSAHSKKIYRLFGKHPKAEWPDDSVPSALYNVTFKAFVDYYLAGHTDIHWVEQHKYCHPCFGFDYIGRKETYSDDVVEVLKLVDADPKFYPYHPLNPTNSDDNEVLLKYYSTLSDDQFKKLMKILSTDLRYYGYTIPDVIKRPNITL